MDNKKKVTSSLIIDIICLILNIVLLFAFQFFNGIAKVYILIPIFIVWMVSIWNFYLVCDKMKNEENTPDECKKENKIENTLMIIIIIIMIFANLFGLL